jgi:hypothetical protein
MAGRATALYLAATGMPWHDESVTGYTGLGVGSAETVAMIAGLKPANISALRDG